MILVDTSVWIDHFRRGDAILSGLLNGGRVLMHPFVLGELALGGAGARAGVLADLGHLPLARVAGDEEVLYFIAANGLAGTGIGYVDAHLLAATRLGPGTRLWSRDKRLHAAAARLGLAHEAVGLGL